MWPLIKRKTISAKLNGAHIKFVKVYFEKNIAHLGTTPIKLLST
jgi:hypothetical protein